MTKEAEAEAEKENEDLKALENLIDARAQDLFQNFVEEFRAHAQAQALKEDPDDFIQEEHLQEDDAILFSATLGQRRRDTILCTLTNIPIGSAHKFAAVWVANDSIHPFNRPGQLWIERAMMLAVSEGRAGRDDLTTLISRGGRKNIHSTGAVDWNSIYEEERRKADEMYAIPKMGA